MVITFQQFTQLGKRSNNEDYVLCLPDRGIFIVCDGVGGATRGEVASELVSNSIADYFSNNTFSVESDIFELAVRKAEMDLTSQIKKNPEYKGMATTLTFLHLYENAFIAHVGDSRVYHIRDGKVMFVTRDHSYVNELLASGFINEEEAKNHPKRNIITRALQGSQSPATPDFEVIENLEANDYFLLCSDGVSESIDTEFINTNFIEEQSVDEIIKKMKELCAVHSLDNNSAIIIKVIEKD